MAIIPALMPVIAQTTLQAPAASVSLVVPSGYEILFLEWSDVYGNSIASRDLYMTFNGDTAGNYDGSMQQFGAASITSNAELEILIGAIGDTDGIQQHSSGFATIFNRDGAEKVVIGTRFRVDKADGSGTIEDVVGYHIEGKWRTTSGVITTLTITASANNMTAGSRFILRGLRTSGAPALGSQDIVQFIGSVDVNAGGSVTFPTIPSGYSLLWLFTHDITSDNNNAASILLPFNSDTGAYYDYSNSSFGTASSTVNAASNIIVGTVGDDDGVDYHSHGFHSISNRKGQEKVLIGTHVRHQAAGANQHDLDGKHHEGKWRNKEDEISTLTLASGGGSFDRSGKAWLFGLKI